MGLDTVELAMEIEDTFEISIPDRDAEQMNTPNDVADWLMSRLKGPASSAPQCATARTFYRMRAELVSDFGVGRKNVRPNSILNDLVPQQRGMAWRRFARKHHLPRKSILDFAFFGKSTDSVRLSMRDAVDYAVSFDSSHWFSTDGQPIRDKILLTVRRIVTEQMGLKLEEVRPDSRFIQDLGMDETRPLFL